MSAGWQDELGFIRQNLGTEHELFARTEVDLRRAEEVVQFYQGLVDRLQGLKDETKTIDERYEIARAIDSDLTDHMKEVQESCRR